MNSDRFDPASLAGAAGLGAVAGLRSMMPPALLSQAALTGSINLEGTPFKFLSTQRAADIATAAAVLELVADKLPFAPARTEPAGLIARAVSGAFVGAVLSAARKQDLAPGAVVGAAAAIGAAFAGYMFRRAFPGSFLAAFTEDAAAVGSGVAVLRSEAGRQVSAR